jgi:phosphate transport system substrate-binding protein
MIRKTINAATVALLAVVLWSGCQKQSGPVETPTSGKLLVYASEAHLGLVQTEAEAFTRLYPQAEITVVGANTRKSLVFLINDSVRMVVSDRRFNSEERQAIQKAELEIQELRFAEDALAWLVHQRNAMRSISLQTMEGLLRGRITQWEQLPESGLSGPIDLVLTDRNSGVYDLLTNRFFKLEQPPAATTWSADQADVLHTIAKRPLAIGIASVAGYKADPLGRNLPDSLNGPVHTLGLAGVDSTGRPRNYQPYPFHIWKANYALHYSLFATYNTESKLAAGFAAFIASAPGQKIVQNFGLVWANMPIRVVQIN